MRCPYNLDLCYGTGLEPAKFMLSTQNRTQLEDGQIHRNQNLTNKKAFLQALVFLEHVE